MHVVLWILIAAGPIGAIDVIYFHMWKFRLFSRRQSLGEEVTHILRGFSAPAIFGFLILGRPEGLYFWIVAALFFVDTVNSLIDVVIEPASRAPIGVPPAELAIHYIGTTMMGGAWAAYMITGWPTRHAPQVLVPWAAGTFPAFLAPMAWGAVVGSLLLVTFETILVVRYATRAA
jgi:hypothetical protein